MDAETPNCEKGPQIVSAPECFNCGVERVALFRSPNNGSEIGGGCLLCALCYRDMVAPELPAPTTPAAPGQLCRPDETIFSVATRIQARNGQELTEGTKVPLAIDHEFSANDREKFPQAERQLRDGFSLAVTTCGAVWSVPADELAGREILSFPETLTGKKEAREGADG